QLARRAGEADPAAGGPELRRDPGELLAAAVPPRDPAVGGAVRPSWRPEAVGDGAILRGTARRGTPAVGAVDRSAAGVGTVRGARLLGVLVPGRAAAPAVGGQREAHLPAGAAAAGDDPWRGSRRRRRARGVQLPAEPAHL